MSAGCSAAAQPSVRLDPCASLHRLSPLASRLHSHSSYSNQPFWRCHTRFPPHPSSLHPPPSTLIPHGHTLSLSGCPLVAVAWCEVPCQLASSPSGRLLCRGAEAMNPGGPRGQGRPGVLKHPFPHCHLNRPFHRPGLTMLCLSSWINLRPSRQLCNSDSFALAKPAVVRRFQDHLARQCPG